MAKTARRRVGRATGGPRAGLLRAAFGICLLWALLALPAKLALPLEWPLALALLTLLPPGPARWLRRIVLLAAAVLLFLALADRGTGEAFGRSFNPLLDLHLLVSGWHLLSGSVGLPAAIGFIAAALAAFVVLLALLGWGLAGLARLPIRRRRELGMAALVLFVAAAGLLVRWPQPTAGFQVSQRIVERVEAFGASAREFAEFERRLAEDAGLPRPAGLLEALEGRDVLLLFVESYGRSAVEDPRYSGVIGPRLDAFERTIAEKGFAARSGWLTSPTVGGQSWLAHSTLLSGLKVDSELRYQRLMASRRESLNRLFAETGWRTVGIMPAITMEWPEGAWYGYDALYARNDLGYRGKPFNWVTMPDQYTLRALQGLELGRPDGPPVMAEVALISSHAPWTPIPPLLPWDAVGDGSAFDPYAEAGDPPEVVWRDPERIRSQYVKAVDYSLETIASFVATYGTRNTVLIILGDHQPAPVVTGEGASRDVPVHILAADPALLDALAGWPLGEGMRPPNDVPAMPMEDFAARFVETFSR